MANTLAELVFIPAPGVGHMMSAIEIAKLLVNRDRRLSITVLIIKPPGPGSGSPLTTYINSLAKNTSSRISFIELPQDETPPMSGSKNPLTFYNEYIKSHCKHVRNVVTDLISRKPGSAKIAGFVIDMFCTSMMDVANEFNVPTYIFFTSNAAFLGFKYHIQTLCDEHHQDIIELGRSDSTISVPSFIKPVPTKVFPVPIRSKETLDLVMSSAREFRKVKAFMVNTFLELETHAIESLARDDSVPPVYPVGPILNLEGGSGVDKPFDNEVISWLDKQPASSVVFLCFGSMGSFDEVQVKEIARALEQSGHRFLWSLRRPPLDQTSRVPGDFEDPGVVLPEGFLARTSGIGKVIGWAPQVTLLAHPAVGGFVTHCGWNSLLESLWFGVPTAAWPIYAEQQINAFEMVEELKLAVEIKLDYMKDAAVVVTAEEIESGIRRVMEDDEVRANVKEMSNKSRAAVLEGGSSYESVGCLIQEFVKNIS